jgi:hypothetical protein
MGSIKDELSQFEEGGKILPSISKRNLLFFIVVLLFGFYISVLLFGKNSLIKLINLREERIILQEMVYKQNLENAQLQKEYFEMQLLEEEKE